MIMFSLLYYFSVLCGNRVSQMTRAYDDIEAVTRLLEEKEKDLELTVQIGKELLTQNGRLEKRIVDLEAELKKSNEERAQLAHDLHQKSELIAVLTNDIDEGNETGELIMILLFPKNKRQSWYLGNMVLQLKLKIYAASHYKKICNTKIHNLSTLKQQINVNSLLHSIYRT